jgi:hypothetical protein
MSLLKITISLVQEFYNAKGCQKKTAFFILAAGSFLFFELNALYCSNFIFNIQLL